jgi:FAD/FMN-containing dehydrogenase
MGATRAEFRCGPIGEVHQNYADSDLTDWPEAYYGANYPRLWQVKQRYDPDDFFHHPQSIRLP